jgi:hypothetical protein
MAVQPSVLTQLFTTKAHTYILAADNARVPGRANYNGPLAQPNPQYFMKYAQGVATGIAIGTPSVNFITADTGVMGAPPIPGAGAGIGIIVDALYFEKTCYSLIQQALQAKYNGTSVIEPYASLTPTSNGVYLKAICQALGEAIKEHYATCWTLTSVHPLIYIGTGLIVDGAFSGIQQNLVSSSIMGQLSGFNGDFLQTMIDQIALAYKMTIEKMSTGQVAIVGVCVPSPGQICGIGSVGAGTGVAT